MSIRTTICTLAGALAVAVVIALTPQNHFSPHGILLPVQNVRSPISADQVVIYTHAPKTTFARLGTVSVEQKYRTLDAETKDTLFLKVKTLAAGVGANGVIINAFEPNNTEVGAVLAFIGTAVYIPSHTRGAQ